MQGTPIYSSEKSFLKLEKIYYRTKTTNCLWKIVDYFVSTKAKHVIWWSQYCEHQGLACEADEDYLMKNLLEPT